MNRLNSPKNVTSISLDPQISDQKTVLCELMLQCFRSTNSRVEVKAGDNNVDFTLSMDAKYLNDLRDKISKIEYNLKPEVRSHKLAQELFEDFKLSLHQVTINQTNFEKYVKYEPTIKRCLNIFGNKVNLLSALNLKNKFEYNEKFIMETIEKSILPLFELSKEELGILGEEFIKPHDDARVKIEERYDKGFVEKISTDGIVKISLYSDNYDYEFPMNEVAIDNCDTIVSELRNKNVPLSVHSISEYVNSIKYSRKKYNV